ncbi:MAG: hypothetical protein AAF821_00715 [Cyanobacteria bacterium P01_D01_bin.156]
MDIQARINRQRVNHIVDSYHLTGDDVLAFEEYLTRLLNTYPQPLIELAITEEIIQGWLKIPMQKGLDFIQKVHTHLQVWQPVPEELPPLPSSIRTLTPKILETSVVNVEVTNTALVNSALVKTKLTPEQFEQITGLDSSLVFDQHGQVIIDASAAP